MKNYFFTILLIFVSLTSISFACDDINYFVSYVSKDVNGCFNDLTVYFEKVNCTNNCFSEYSTIKLFTDKQDFQTLPKVMDWTNPSIIVVKSINCSLGSPIYFNAIMEGEENTCELSFKFEDEYNKRIDYQKKINCQNKGMIYDNNSDSCIIDSDEDIEVIESEKIQEDTKIDSQISPAGGVSGGSPAGGAPISPSPVSNENTDNGSVEVGVIKTSESNPINVQTDKFLNYDDLKTKDTSNPKTNTFPIIKIALLTIFSIVLISFVGVSVYILIPKENKKSIKKNSFTNNKKRLKK